MDTINAPKGMYVFGRPRRKGGIDGIICVDSLVDRNVCIDSLVDRNIFVSSLVGCNPESNLVAGSLALVIADTLFAARRDVVDRNLTGVNVVSRLSRAAATSWQRVSIRR